MRFVVVIAIAIMSSACSSGNSNTGDSGTNLPPTFTSRAHAVCTENSDYVMVVEAEDTDGPTLTFGIGSGADSGCFTIDPISGILDFVAPPDYERPSDTDHNNIYAVTVTVDDGMNLVSQTITVVVDNIDPQLQWERRFGGTDGDYPTVVIPFQGDYLIGGDGCSGISGDRSVANKGFIGSADMWILRIADDGSIVWDACFGGSGSDTLYDIVPCADGGLLLVGASTSNISGDKSTDSFGYLDMWVLKVDSSMNREWDATFGGSSADRCQTAIETDNGDFILCGTSFSPQDGNKSQDTRGSGDVWIVRIDSEGNHIWDRRFGGTGLDYGRDIIDLGNDQFLIGGQSDSPNGDDVSQACLGSSDFWLLKIDGDGTLLWNKRYGGTASDAFRQIIPNTDGNGYILAGKTLSPIGHDVSQSGLSGYDYWLLNITPEGTVLWDRRYCASSGNGEEFGGIISCNDGGYLLAGGTSSDAAGDKTEDSRGGTDFWIVKTDSHGLFQWDRTIGGSLSDTNCTITAAPYDGCLVLGWSESPISGEKSQSCWGEIDYWLVHLAEWSPSTAIAQNVVIP